MPKFPEAERWPEAEKWPEATAWPSATKWPDDGGGPPPPPDTPLTIITSTPVLLWCRSDLGITLETGVRTWEDQSGGGSHFQQATLANQPAYLDPDATINNLPSLTGDGSNDLMSSTISLSVGTFVWLIFKQVTWTIGDRVMGGNTAGVARMIVRQDATGVTPDLEQTNAGNGAANSGAPIGEWKRLEVHHTDTASDYLKVGSVTVTGVDTGAPGTVTAYEIFRAVTGNSNVAIAEIVICGALPTAGELTNMDTYCTTRYGASLIT